VLYLIRHVISFGEVINITYYPREDNYVSTI
jgi:hypothetical protein